MHTHRSIVTCSLASRRCLLRPLKSSRWITPAARAAGERSVEGKISTIIGNVRPRLSALPALQIPSIHEAPFKRLLVFAIFLALAAAQLTVQAAGEVTRPSGLRIIDVKPGSGPVLQPGQTVTVTLFKQTLTTAVGPKATWAVAAEAVPAGTYSVVARVRDAAGNAAVQTLSMTFK